MGLICGLGVRGTGWKLLIENRRRSAMPIITFIHRFYCSLCGNQIVVSGSIPGYKPTLPVIFGGKSFEIVHIKCDKCNAKGVYDPRKEVISFFKK